MKEQSHIVGTLDDESDGQVLDETRIADISLRWTWPGYDFLPASGAGASAPKDASLGLHAAFTAARGTDRPADLSLPVPISSAGSVRNDLSDDVFYNLWDTEGSAQRLPHL
ncbi:MAG TPA: hypothetical protein VNE63_16050 [Candidatus Acidoferrales bacterium]|nr:hypothetical protein [Candidatus Acidoferrales bacterium]